MVYFESKSTLIKHDPADLLCAHCKNKNECNKNSIACAVYLELENVIDNEFGE